MSSDKLRSQRDTGAHMRRNSSSRSTRMNTNTVENEDTMDAKERRRLQNRIAQRNHRQKKAAQGAEQTVATGTTGLNATTCSHCGMKPTAAKAAHSQAFHPNLIPGNGSERLPLPVTGLPAPTHSIDPHHTFSIEELAAGEDHTHLNFMRDHPDLFEVGGSNEIDVTTFFGTQDGGLTTEIERQRHHRDNSISASSSVYVQSTSQDGAEDSGFRQPRATKGQLALHLASRGGYASVVELLLRNGALHDLADEHGRTALHYAVEEGHVETTKVLLTWGANIKTMDAAGLSSLHIAASKGHEDVVSLLMELGADPNIRTT